MSSGVLIVTNHMMNHDDSRVKHLQQFKCGGCKKPVKYGHFLHIMCLVGSCYTRLGSPNM